MFQVREAKSIHPEEGGEGMKCKKCRTDMLMIIEGSVILGTGDITTYYVCPKCGEEWKP
jgi:DNA-directed RNA polymerase subunit M/transcription elongation factor TFIIS